MWRSTLVLASLCFAARGARLADANSPFVVEGEYIVSLHANVTEADHNRLVARFNGSKFHIGKFRGLHAALKADELAWVLSQDQLVQLVEPNELMFADQPSCPAFQQEPVSWGQVRTTTYSARDINQVFAHNPQWGAGVDAYVLDTGIRCTHVEFSGGRCVWGANFAGGQATDVNGHGTHCAGTIAGAQYGIAKSATVIAVKVLSDSGSGSIAGIINGVQYAVGQRAVRGRPGTANMSLGGTFSQALSDACREAVAQGLFLSTSGGNNNRNSCLDSPNNEPTVMTVGATELGNVGGQQVDNKASYSNWGPCITLWAPGSQITSAGVNTDTSYSVLSGTSMACPHAVGVMAAKLTGGRQTTPAVLFAEMVAQATPNVVMGLDTQAAPSPNIMMHLQC